MKIDLDTPRFRLSEAAPACGMNVATLRKYYFRETFLIMDHDQAAEVAGQPSKLSLRSVLTVAIAAQLISIGVTPKNAFFAGLKFTHLSTHAADNVEGLARQPGELFDTSAYRSLLVWQPAPGSPAGAARVIPVPWTSAAADQPHHQCGGDGERPHQDFDLDEVLDNPITHDRGPAAIVELNRVVAAVYAALIG